MFYVCFSLLRVTSEDQEGMVDTPDTHINTMMNILDRNDKSYKGIVAQCIDAMVENIDGALPLFVDFCIYVIRKFYLGVPHTPQYTQYENSHIFSLADVYKTDAAVI